MSGEWARPKSAVVMSTAGNGDGNGGGETKTMIFLLIFTKKINK